MSIARESKTQSFGWRKRKGRNDHQSSAGRRGGDIDALNGKEGGRNEDAPKPDAFIQRSTRPEPVAYSLTGKTSGVSRSFGGGENGKIHLAEWLEEISTEREKWWTR